MNDVCSVIEAVSPLTLRDEHVGVTRIGFSSCVVSVFLPSFRVYSMAVSKLVYSL